MTKILNKDDLGLYLKILAEESVRNAYEFELAESQLFEKGEEKEDDDPLFGGDETSGDTDVGGDEVDDDPLAAMADDADDSGEEEAPEPSPEPKEKVETRPTPLYLELGEVTSDGLFATLNMIRAGRSFKEPDVSAQMKIYFEDQLNDSEKLALATFLSAIRDLTSGTPAKDAPEPGDENVTIDATGAEREQHDPEADQRTQSQPALQQRPQPAASTPRGVEDTSPPIQVGPRNRRLSEEYRRHIRSLLVN